MKVLKKEGVRRAGHMKTLFSVCGVSVRLPTDSFLRPDAGSIKLIEEPNVHFDETCFQINLNYEIKLQKSLYTRHKIFYTEHRNPCRALSFGVKHEMQDI